MLIVILGLATIMAAVWIILLCMVGQEDWITGAYNKVVDNRMEIQKLRIRDSARRERLNQYTGTAAKVMRFIEGGDSSKKIEKLNKENDQLQSGILRGVNIFDMPGYVLQRRFEGVGKGSVHKMILTKCMELYGKKYGANKAKQLMARMLSYPIIGVAASLSIGALVAASGNWTGGIVVVSVGSLIVLCLVYAMYDEVGDQLNKRRSAISRQFPNVVSKLALLVTSGMIMDRAWRETAESQETELYQEMRRTADELDNLVGPTAAYTNFINRCNTKETTKLASAIIQNQSKGNAEIGHLLKDMAHEAWQERRHTAKRDSEKANSKLMIPTMLLFIAILVMIMVPVAMTFSAI